MAELNEKTGTITANCPGCKGAKSSFAWKDERGEEYGSIVKLPAKNLTSCCFGGKDLKTLFVTSANFDLADINDVGEGAGFVFKSNVEEIIA